MKIFTFRQLIMVSILVCVALGFVVYGVAKTRLAERSSSTSQTPVVPPMPTTQEIRAAIDAGAAAREKGDYQIGEEKLAWAFDGAIALQDKALTIEAGNNVSIQYRLSAGRANRAGQKDLANSYSEKSLAVYQKLKDLGWFDEKDPASARNWAHALLYAGKLDEAVVALKSSLALQTAPAAQGDESNHLAAAYLSQGKAAEAKTLFTKGINLIEKNNGSKIWLTFGLMTKATWEAQHKQSAMATKTLQEAVKIAQDNNLLVRQEELEHLTSLPPDQINVLETVGTPQK